MQVTTANGETRERPYCTIPSIGDIGDVVEPKIGDKVTTLDTHYHYVYNLEKEWIRSTHEHQYSRAVSIDND